MLCATAEVNSPAARSSDEAERNCILGDVVGGDGGRLLVVMSVVATRSLQRKRDKLAIIHKLGAVPSSKSAGSGTLGRSGSRVLPPIGWIPRVESDTDSRLRAT